MEVRDECFPCIFRMKEIEDKVNKVVIIILMCFISISTFMVLYIPVLAGIMKFLVYVTSYETVLTNNDLILYGVVSCIMAFGALFICLAIMAKVLEYFASLYDFEKMYHRYENPGELV